MVSTVTALKGAFVVAVWVVLLHSSMAQQPAPAPVSALNCSQCSPYCDQKCQSIATSDFSKCNDSLALSFYAGCFKSCTTPCNGKSYVARCSCRLHSCSAKSCGPQCAVDCCETCTRVAGEIVSRCMADAGRVMQFCMPSCINQCSNDCVNGSAPPPPPMA